MRRCASAPGNLASMKHIKRHNKDADAPASMPHIAAALSGVRPRKAAAAAGARRAARTDNLIPLLRARKDCTRSMHEVTMSSVGDALKKIIAHDEVEWAIDAAVDVLGAASSSLSMSRLFTRATEVLLHLALRAFVGVTMHYVVHEAAAHVTAALPPLP